MFHKRLNLCVLSVFVLSFFQGCKEKVEDIVIGNCIPSSEILLEKGPKDQIYSKLIKKYAKKGLPGLVMLVDKEKEELWVGAAGFAKIENKTPMQPCNLFFSGGMGKLFTATSTMQFIQDGILNLNDNISKFLPTQTVNKIPNGDKLTIGHLLSHSSGIVDFEDNSNFLLDYLNNHSMKLNREIVLNRYVYNSSPLFNPGKKQKYSSSNYEILSMILDHVSETNHSKLFSEKIFNELNLKSTFYKNEKGYPFMENQGLVNGYLDRMSVGKIENFTDVMINYANSLSGSRGVIGTVHNYYKFLKNIMAYNFLNEVSLHDMKTYPNTEYGIKEPQYGLGFMLRHTSHGLAIGHSGSTFGSAIELWYFVDKKTYLCLATNVSNFYNNPAQDIFDDKLWEEVLRVVF